MLRTLQFQLGYFDGGGTECGRCYVKVVLQVRYPVIRLDELVVELCNLGDEILNLGSEG
jgi:hypothetical protein